ncbi:hypothetical protein niasHT_000774 [Heterodera trifolii]|uniref:Uncharacterized protein n=1 Tax=Heterodera trifolii TaxID=157864 RepID=A0ABD2LNK8_9BILA
MAVAAPIATMALLCQILAHFETMAAKISRKSYETQLYEDLLFNYNKIARPVKNIANAKIPPDKKHLLAQDEKNQVLTTNLWLEMRWNDAKLQWNPKKYGGIRQLHIPSTDIWVPDFVLYDNAAGDPDITCFGWRCFSQLNFWPFSKVSFNGRVYWQPPAIYKSFCPIKVKWFPYDKQECKMKFGAWSYTGFYVDLRQLPRDQIEVRHSEKEGDYEYMENGMDLSFFHRSAEWDLMNLTAARHDVLYASCCGPEKLALLLIALLFRHKFCYSYANLLRRKTLFFTCNLIVPCFLISFLTTFVFYLSDHKITFSISILVTLTVFFLVLIDLTPPTSLEVPMFAQYLITTMILVALSTMVSVVTVNIRFRSGATHQMSPWVRVIFLNFLPKILFMKRPERPPKFKLSAQSERGQMSKSVSPISANDPPNALASICPSLMAKTTTERPNSDGTTNANSKEDYRHFKAVQQTNEEKISPPFVSPSSVDPSQVFFRAINAPINRPKVPIPPPPYSHSFESTKKCRPSSILPSQTLPNSKLSMPNSENRNGVGHRMEMEREGRRRANDAIFANLVKQVRFIAEYFQRCEEEAEISDDWTFVAMVLDRLFLVIFSVLNMATFSIIVSAPSLFDFREPLNVTVPTRPLGQANLFSKNAQ